MVLVGCESQQEVGTLSALLIATLIVPFKHVLPNWLGDVAVFVVSIIAFLSILRYPYIIYNVFVYWKCLVFFFTKSAV